MCRCGWGRLRGPLPAQVTVTARAADGQPFRQMLTPKETPDSAVRTLWARARVLDLEHRFAADPRREPGLADRITAFSLRYGVLCRFTAFVAVDRSETVNPGGEVLQVTQAVEPPAERRCRWPLVRHLRAQERRANVGLHNR